MSFQGYHSTATNGYQPKTTVHVTSRESEDSTDSDDVPRKKIILCFDGTSNSFKGNDSDTNVVKLFEMFDRSGDKHQYHYYQPGIGTYNAGARIRNVESSTGRLAKVFDEMFAPSFCDHVLAGYKFLMRYYMEDDQVYIFGFSRGAYTARFLCEMLDKVGLLSKGNEENLAFLWYQYVAFRQNPEDRTIKEKLQAMSRTFCRKEESLDGEPTKPFTYFLGLWDCVNSVARFMKLSEIQKHAIANPNIAYHVRHALSGHERRVMFKPTLFLSEKNEMGSCEERWFAGNHGNVGGGWDPIKDKHNPDNSLLLSDIPLIWMVEELRKAEELDIAKGEPITRPLSWRKPMETKFPETTFEARKQKHEDCMRLFSANKLHLERPPSELANDVLTFSRSGNKLTSKLMVLVWRFMECLPLAHTYLALKHGENWQRHGEYRIMSKDYFSVATWWPNLGSPRRIPQCQEIDPSVDELIRLGIAPGAVRQSKDREWKYLG